MHNYTCTCRCLLSKKAAPVMKLIQNIFSSILKFSSELTGERVCVERSYATMTETHNRFREVSGLLIKGECLHLTIYMYSIVM